MSLPSKDSVVFMFSWRIQARYSSTNTSRSFYENAHSIDRSRVLRISIPVSTNCDGVCMSWWYAVIEDRSCTLRTRSTPYYLVTLQPIILSKACRWRKQENLCAIKYYSAVAAAANVSRPNSRGARHRSIHVTTRERKKWDTRTFDIKLMLCMNVGPSPSS